MWPLIGVMMPFLVGLQEFPLGDENMNMEKLVGYVIGILKAMGVYTLLSVALGVIILVSMTKVLLGILNR